MFEDLTITLVDAQFRAVIAEIADPELAPLQRPWVSIIVTGFTRPSSSACAAVKILKVEPSS